MCRLTKERGAIDKGLSRPRHPDAQSSVWSTRRFDCFGCVVNCLDSPFSGRQAGACPTELMCQYEAEYDLLWTLRSGSQEPHC